MDPRNVIQHYKSCPLHQSKSNVKGYGLAEMWCFVTQKNDLEGAHSSIVDARAQVEVIMDKRFFKYINKPKSIITLNSVWEAKRMKSKKFRDALDDKLAPPWTSDFEEWNIPNDKRYTGASGGANHGPTTPLRTAFDEKSLASLFLFFFPTKLLENIAKQTNFYGHQEWVKLVQ